MLCSVCYQQFARAAITKCHGLSGLNNRSQFSHSSGGCKSKISIPAVLDSSCCLSPGLADAVSAYMVYSLYSHALGVSSFFLLGPATSHRAPLILNFILSYYILKDIISKYDYILSYSGWGFNMRILEEHNSAHSSHTQSS